MARYEAPTGNLTSSADLFTIMNGWTNNWFFPAILFALFFIMWIRMTFTQTAGRAFAASSFIAMIVAVMLRVANLVSTTVMVIFIIFTGIGIVWAHFENTKGVS